MDMSEQLRVAKLLLRSVVRRICNAKVVGLILSPGTIFFLALHALSHIRAVCVPVVRFPLSAPHRELLSNISHRLPEVNVVHVISSPTREKAECHAHAYTN